MSITKEYPTKLENQGYKPLTRPYSVKRERPYLANVVADMERGGVDYVLRLAAPGYVEVWRRGYVLD